MDEISLKGKLELILGPVFSGKTCELIRRIKRYYLAGYKCLVIRFAADIEGFEDSILTHDGIKQNAILISNLITIQHHAAKFDVIGIDEAHHFSDVYEFCLSASDNGKKVIVAALDSDCERRSFATTLSLIPLSENVNKLTSICMSCSREALFSKKFMSDLKEEEDPKIIPVCSDCFLQQE